MKDDKEFLEALESRKVPILVLDQKWHRLFALIDEVNVKMEEIEDELIELPRNINSANQKLMLESMRYCYERLRQNSKEADEITAWIDKVRVELKKNIIKKQNREINNRQIYSYMHDIFGVDILNIFDLRQEDEERLQGKKAVENADERN